MKKSLALKLGLLFAFFVALFVVGVQAAEDQWVACGDQKVNVKLTRFAGYGVKVLRGDLGELALEDENTGNIRFCYQIGNWWIVDGFATVLKKADSDEKLAVLTLRSQETIRYLNIESGQEVLLETNEEGKRIVSSQIPANFSD